MTTRFWKNAAGFVTLGSLAWLGLAPLAGVSATAAAEDSPEVFQLTMTDGVLQPGTLAVPAGRKFRLEITNAGKTPDEFDSVELNRERLIRPGERTTIFLGPLEPGSYRFMGEFHADTAKGVIIAK